MLPPGRQLDWRCRLHSTSVPKRCMLHRASAAICTSIYGSTSTLHSRAELPSVDRIVWKCVHPYPAHAITLTRYGTLLQNPYRPGPVSAASCFVRGAVTIHALHEPNRAMILHIHAAHVQKNRISRQEHPPNRVPTSFGDLSLARFGA